MRPMLEPDSVQTASESPGASERGLMLDFDRLQTPARDGDILIEPPPDRWPALLAENIRQRRDRRFTLAGQPAGSVLQATRASLLHGPVIASGHQPAFVHPGVWAKHVVLSHAARAFGVEALDLVVDNDAPRSASLPIPVVGPREMVHFGEGTFAAGPAGSAYESRRELTASEIDRIRMELSHALGDRFDRSLMPVYLAGMSKLEHPADSVDQHLAGRLQVDRGLFNIEVAEARVSRVFGGPFLADLLLNPEPFAVAYNRALAKYRQEHRVRAPDRPLPDLVREADRTETALWIYEPRHRRRRLWVSRSSDRVEVFADEVPVGTLSALDLAHDPDTALASLRPWVVRPRALTLTLWARLLACDLFMHGIGGAKYDRITDDMIQRHYRCPPPAYVCVTATLRLPLPSHGVSPSDIQTARRQLRDWRFNPQRHLPHPPDELARERARLIMESDRLRQIRAPHALRRDVYQQIHQVTERLLRLAPEMGSQLLAQIHRLEQQLSSDTIASSREFFYCLQPPGRLEMLAERLCEGW